MVNFGLVEKLEMRPSDIVLARTFPLCGFKLVINALFGTGGNAIGSIDAVVKRLENQLNLNHRSGFKIFFFRLK